ncbi:nitrate ABC transporter substrate-binding protein [Moraxella caviae]|uniref:Nitrate ABC transporter substrate-binding protein n=1 Tax=Moraxella caviae TaxID=34060 RepID=A0A1S9ZUQ1_9GAMM|nr:nitrate ABC transporter substrate-binding protein [Moraxella caviae]
MTKSKTYTQRLLPVLAGVFVITGCAQSGDNESAKNTADELIIALDWVPNTNHTGLYVAIEQGYFAQEGLSATIVQPSEDSASVLVASQRADLGVYFQPNMVKRLVKGEPITAIAAIAQHNSVGLLSLQSLGAKSPADLHGKRYSTWEDAVDDATVANVVGAPLNPVPGESTDATTALRMGLFDYVLAYYSWDGIHAGLKGVPTNFFYLKDANPTFDYYAPVLIANNEKLAQNPERYKKALNAISKGYQYAAQNPEQSAKILLKYAPETNSELAHASQAFMSQQYLAADGSWGYFDDARWNRFYRWVYEQGLVDKPFADGAGMSNDYLPAKSAADSQTP